LGIGFEEEDRSESKGVDSDFAEDFDAGCLSGVVTL